jgi:hypothetical protein
MKVMVGYLPWLEFGLGIAGLFSSGAVGRFAGTPDSRDTLPFNASLRDTLLAESVRPKAWSRAMRAWT